MEHRVPHKMPHTMLLHGLGQNSDSWKQVIDCLPTEQKEELHTPDLFALSEEISYEGLYRGWEQSCQKLPGRLHLCGLSLGAVLALFSNQLKRTLAPSDTHSGWNRWC